MLAEVTRDIIRTTHNYIQHNKNKIVTSQTNERDADTEYDNKSKKFR